VIDRLLTAIFRGVLAAFLCVGLGAAMIWAWS
jgi:hypothetical protein